MKKTDEIISDVTNIKGIRKGTTLGVNLNGDLTLKELKFLQLEEMDNHVIKSLLDIAQENNLHLHLKRSGAGISVKLSNTVNI